MIAMLRMRRLPRRVKQSADLWVRRILDDRYAKIKDPGDHLRQSERRCPQLVSLYTTSAAVKELKVCHQTRCSFLSIPTFV